MYPQVSKCASLGIHLDTSSAAAIQASLNCYVYRGNSDNPDNCILEKMILVVLCSKIMEVEMNIIYSFPVLTALPRVTATGVQRCK